MIAFDSPDGLELRAKRIPRAALMALWYCALNTRSTGWADWAEAKAMRQFPEDLIVLALRFLKALNEGDVRRSRLLWVVFSSYPVATSPSRIVREIDALARQAMAAMTEETKAI